MKIGFIGAGNMGGAIIKGYLAKEPAKAGDVSIFDIDAGKLEKIRGETGARACASAEELAARCDLVIIGVKPDQYDDLLPRISAANDNRKIWVSMAAGISIAYIETFVGGGAKIIRIMPNTPAMVGEGMTALCRNQNVSEEEARLALDIFGSIGKAKEVPETQIHCVIGVSGSSPAYTYMYIEALADAAERNGMDRDQAISFAAQSVLGAAKMVLETGISPEELCMNVCSPGGATMEAVEKLRENGFAGIVREGFQAAVDKSKKMVK